MMKNKFKTLTKVIGMSLSMIMLFQVSIFASDTSNADIHFLPQDNQTVLEFNESDYNNAMTTSDIATEKLLQGGFTQSFISSISESSLQKIANSNKAIVSMTYYSEEADGMVRISSEDFTQRSSPLYSIPDLSTDNISVIDDDGNILYGPQIVDEESAGLSFSPYYMTQNVDNGTVQVNTALYGVSNGIYSQYVAMSEFIWTTMPKYRGTDFFGITRGTNTVTIPNAWSRYYEYDRTTYSLHAPANGGGIMTQVMRTDTTTQSYMYNEDATNPTKGYAYRISVPVDVVPSAIFAGQTLNAYVNSGLRGGILYEGALQTPSLAPQYLNHWGTYQHQNGVILFSSPSISVPWGASITVSPSGSYSNPIVDTILSTWWG